MLPLPENTEPFEPRRQRKEAEEQVHADLMYLAARLIHRGAQTQEEADASSYIFGRFRERTPDVVKDPFTAIDNPLYLFASLYAEFLFVAIIAFWFPGVAALYGAVVFGCYLAEFMGFPLASRFLAHYESQNVIARFLSPRPRNLIIVTAHYDSGFACPLTTERALPWLRPLHLLVLGLMALVIASCAADAYALYTGNLLPLATYARWSAVALLGCAALALYYASSCTEEVRGANNNASGVCALLRLADRMAAEPVMDADVWLVATGSNEAWFAGMRALLASHTLDRKHTYLLNLEGVGAGELCYTTAEGMLLEMPCHRDWKQAAGAVADVSTAGGAAQARPLRSVPTATQIALARGYRAMSIVGIDEKDAPARWNCTSDLITGVDREQIAQAALFAEATVRRLARDLAN